MWKGIFSINRFSQVIELDKLYYNYDIPISFPLTVKGVDEPLDSFIEMPVAVFEVDRVDSVNKEIHYRCIAIGKYK